MVIKNIDFEKYNKMAEKSFYRKLGKVVNVVGLTIESAGPDSKLGDLCRILPDAEGARPIMAEVVMRPEAMPIMKRPTDKISALSAKTEMIKPRLINTKPICKVLKKPILLLVRPRNNRVPRQPNI